MSEENKAEPLEPATKAPSHRRKVTPKRVRPQRAADQTPKKTFAMKAAEDLLKEFKPATVRYGSPSQQRKLEDGDQAFILCQGCRAPGVFLVDLPRGSRIAYNMWFSTYKDVDEPYFRKGAVCQQCGDRLKGRSDGGGNLTLVGGHARAVCTFKHIDRLKEEADAQRMDWQARKRAAVVQSAG